VFTLTLCNFYVWWALHLHRQNLTIWFSAKKIICIFQANTKLILIDGTCWLGLFCWIIACLNPKPRHNSHSLFCRLYRGECHNFLTQFYSQKKLIWCTQNLNKPLYSNSSLNRCLYFCKIMAQCIVFAEIDQSYFEWNKYSLSW